MTAYPIAANGALCVPAQTEQYLSILFRHVDWQPGQVISLLGIGEKGTDQDGRNGKPFKERKIIAPAFLGAAHAHIRRWSEHHVATFAVPAVLHGAAEAQGDVTLDKVAALTAILLDLDSGDIDAKAAFVIARLGPPTMIVLSGGSTPEGQAKRHLYWLLNEPCEEVEALAATRKQLAAKAGGDQSFGRATQVVRVPGSVHAKNGVASVCRIIEARDVDYSFDELADIIETMEPMPGLPLPVAATAPLPFSGGSMMDFSPRQDTAMAALHRDVAEGGVELTRFGEATKVFGFQIAEARAGRISPSQAYANAEGWMLQHMSPPWPAGRFATEFEALARLDVKNHGPFPDPRPIVTGPVLILPSLATWPGGHLIPPRPWIFGKWIQRGIVTAMVAPGGVGKSSLVTAMTLSLASGRPFLGKDVWGGPQRVWSWNLEDNGDNLARSRIAASIYHGVGAHECGDRLFIDSGPEGATLCTATEDRNGFTIIEPVMQAICEAIVVNKIDVLIIDPFVSSHAVSENDNNKIDAVVKAWAMVARITNCGIMLVHHSSKLRGEQVTGESARGASALNNAARMTLVLNRMAAEQADSWGIDPISALGYFSVGDDKHNHSAAAGADWFKLESVALNNASDTHPGDEIGVVTRWQPPRLLDGVEPGHLYEIQKVLNLGTYWRDPQSKTGWVGEVIGNIVGIDTVAPASKKRIKAMVDLWMKSGALKVEPRRDAEGKRAMRDCVTVGHWAPKPFDGS